MSENLPGPIEVFISHKWLQPDLEMAESLHQQLTEAGHNTFLDAEDIRIGDHWVEQIDRGLRECRVFIVLLSPSSVLSDMVIEEVRTIKKRWEEAELDPEKGPKPVILQVRYNNPALPYDLRGYLNRFQYASLQPNKEKALPKEQINALWQEITGLVEKLKAAESDITQPVQPSEFEIGNQESPLKKETTRTDLALTTRGLATEPEAFETLDFFYFANEDPGNRKHNRLDQVYRGLEDEDKRSHKSTHSSVSAVRVQGDGNITLQGINNSIISIMLNDTGEQESQPASDQAPEALKDFIPEPLPEAPSKMPTGAMEQLFDRYYIERPGEKLPYEALKTPRAVIRIKGPRQFGKSSLLNRLTRHAIQKDYHIISLSFQSLGRGPLQDLDLLLKQMCQVAGKSLGWDRKTIRNKIEEYWDDISVCTMKCQYFFEDEILSKLEHPLLLAMDEVDLVSGNQDLAHDFYPMLRAWVDSTKNDSRWDKFNLIMTYATDLNALFHDLNSSPFNIGTVAPADQPFGIPELKKLAKAYQFNPDKIPLEKIRTHFGGHPFLSQHAFFQVASGLLDWEHLWKAGTEATGQTKDHLLRHYYWVQKNGLQEALRNVDQKGKTEFIPKLRLEAAGLVQESNGQLSLSSELYQDFFRKNL